MIGKLPPLEEWMIRDNPCEFTDDYLTGIEIVDLEHQQLFCIVDARLSAGKIQRRHYVLR